MHRAFVMPHTVYIPENHHAGTIEIVTVMAGSIELTIGEKTYSLQTFDSIQFSAAESHRYHNPGEEEAVFASNDVLPLIERIMNDTSEMGS
ncbi:cupin domain-containing protein [Bacillus cereus]|nr:cupin domain-containing protein [Paenibacillus dendritiformis]MEB9896906.1 cupin domain-containing protein [Bacillus cereus]